MTTWKKLLIIPAVALAGGGLSLAVNHSYPVGADSDPPIVQEVKHQGEVLQNHEDRIGNLEKDAADLQKNTNTPPSSSRVVVREVTTPSASEPLSINPPAPQPAPQSHDPREIMNINTQLILNPQGNSTKCQYFLYDGTVTPYTTCDYKVGEIHP